MKVALQEFVIVVALSAVFDNMQRGFWDADIHSVTRKDAERFCSYCLLIVAAN